MKTNCETNRKAKTMAMAKEITFQETQGIKIFLLVVATIFITISLAGYFITTEQKIRTLEHRVETLTESKAALSKELVKTTSYSETTIDELRSNLTISEETIQTLSAQVETLVEDNKSLAASYDEVYSKYKVLAERKELYDKYEYVTMYGGKRTDVTYDQIKTGEQLMLEKGYNPHILFSTIMVESRGTETAKNAHSTATGYGQILKGTGKYVYEVLLGNGKGTYIHSMAKDGDTNILMSVTYLSYLLDRNNGDIVKAMKGYSGRDLKGTYSYISMMNGFSKTKGVNILNLSSR